MRILFVLAALLLLQRLLTATAMIALLISPSTRVSPRTGGRAALLTSMSDEYYRCYVGVYSFFSYLSTGNVTTASLPDDEKIAWIAYCFPFDGGRFLSSVAVTRVLSPCCVCSSMAAGHTS